MAGLQQHGTKTVSLKRCRLSPSPATGLVGLQENAFLSDYFGCFSFLPFTSQGNIRETLVKMFAAHSSGFVEHPASGDYPTTEQHFDTIVSVGSQLPADPSTSVFWCAVALGALAQGRPIESVAKYSRLARDALVNISGRANTEVARAWSILAYLCDFCGEQENFNKYLQHADDLLRDVGEEELQTLPVGLAEVVKHGASVKIFLADTGREEVEGLCNQPQMTAAATEGDICQVVMRSFRSFQQDIHEFFVEDRESFRGVGDGETCTRIASGVAAGADTRGSSHHFPSRMLDMMQNMTRKHASQVQRVERVAGGPSLRGGIGWFLINGTLVFGKTATMGIRGALDKLDYCGEVLERYPGLCRFRMGIHITHTLVSNLAAIDGPRARRIYEQIREAYNSARRPATAPIPPFEEWQGVSSFCDNLYCRLIEQMVAREYNSPSSASPPQGCANEGLEKGPREVVLDGRHQRGVASAEGCLDDIEGIPACDTRARYMTSDAPRMNREPDRASGEESVGCLERISSDGRWTALTQRPETTQTASLFQEVVVEPRVDSDYRRTVDRENYPSSCTEVETQAAEALMLFDVDTTTVGGTAHDQGVGVEDWLDVTHAMLGTNANGLGPDLV